MTRVRFAVLTAVATVPIVAGWVAVVREPPLEGDLSIPALLTGAALVMLVPALVAEWRRPGNPMSWVAVVAGAATTVGAFRLLRPSGLATLGALAWFALPLVLCHLLLAIPDGLPRALRTRVLVACWLVPTAAAAAVVAVAGPRHTVTTDAVGGLRPQSWAVRDGPGEWTAQANLLVQRPSDLALRALWVGWSLWIVVTACAVVAVAARRWRHNEPDRRTARLVLPAAVFTALAMAASAVTSRPTEHVGGTHFLEQWYGELLIVAPAFATAVVGAVLVWSELVRPRLSQAVDGAIELDSRSSPAALTARVARTLSDPTVRVLFPGHEGAWLDDRGRAVALAADPRRAATIVTRDAVAVAAVEHDDWLLTQPDLLDVAVTLLALTLESRGLAAVAQASTEDTQASASRLLDAGERARRRVEQRLVEGPDRTLAAVSDLLVSHPAPMGEVHAGLRVAVAELREIAHGIAPAALLDAGLEVALVDLAASATEVDVGVVPREPLPRPVALTLYLVAEDAVRHTDQPLRLSVTVEGGAVELSLTGWSGPLDQVIQDRVDTLAGTVREDDAGLNLTLPLESE